MYVDFTIIWDYESSRDNKSYEYHHPQWLHYGKNDIHFSAQPSMFLFYAPCTQLL